MMRKDQLFQADDSHIELCLGDTPVPQPLDETLAWVRRRRAEIDAKQAIIAKILAEMECEAAVLFVPAHLSWFCSGFNVRGLLAESERPGLYTNGKQRWLLCSNLDTQRLFDEELDRLGFQLKEWSWTTGRAALLGDITTGKKVAADRPFPNMPLINEALRHEIRLLHTEERADYFQLGRVVAHAVEAVGRTMLHGESEAEIAGQIAHRLYRHGVELAAVTVVDETRTTSYPRAGFRTHTAQGIVRLQATGTRNGLFVSLARSVYFGNPPESLRAEFEIASKLSGVYRAYAQPGQTFTDALEAGRHLTYGSKHDYDWRYAPIGYGTGRLPAEELRRMGKDEKLIPQQAIVSQARCGRVQIQDTLLVDESGGAAVTPPTDWPFKRIRLQDRAYDVPDLLVRETT